MEFPREVDFELQDERELRRTIVRSYKLIAINALLALVALFSLWDNRVRDHSFWLSVFIVTLALLTAAYHGVRIHQARKLREAKLIQSARQMCAEEAKKAV